ncbi:putative U6 snRNA phosphodiesterase [Penicillium digitatum]|uniref:Putative U6 snRNA phosphodiesterase n=1 Tax=Penicillium digitatum TaxID=36651 RepID=A0A7T6XUI8_PENDI|nr:putative U6 snRNA phosphodiesterase [Penicillium digitatum]
MQVPTVTLDDLQAFQSKHFPGQQPAVFPQENDQTTDEDLGYYPDGIKRTLTDEQIRIFRHSEIHALLRERQLKAEEAQYQSRMQSSTNHGSEGRTDAAPEKRPRDYDSQAQVGKSSKLLKYGDDSDQPQMARPAGSQMPYQGRRIISYDD